MKMNKLGSTGLIVSELCVGTLPMGPLQSNVSVDAGAEFLCAAMENGVNFFDTAQMYKTYAYLKKASELFGKTPSSQVKAPPPIMPVWKRR